MTSDVSTPIRSAQPAPYLVTPKNPVLETLSRLAAIDRQRKH